MWQFTGSVFHKFFQRSDHFSVALERGFFLTLSYLITNTTMNMDRLVIKQILGKRTGDDLLCGFPDRKALVLLTRTDQHNRDLLSDQTQGTVKRISLKAVLAGGGVAGVFFLGCQVGTPLFVWLFYHDLFPSIKGLVTVVNLAQVLGLFSAFLFILVLTFTDEKWQLWIQLAHFVILLTTSVLAAKNYGMIGFAWACLGANTLRVVAVIALGIWKAKPAKKEGE